MKFLRTYSKTYHSAFAKDIKNFDKPLKLKLLNTIDKIALQPSIGEMLTGDLSGVYSYHFSYDKTQYRIAYIAQEDEVLIYFVSVGSRENFYDKLKNRIS